MEYLNTQHPFIVDTDANNVLIGAVLSQEWPDEELVVAFYSQSLNRAECNYCVTWRELLAMVDALHFRPELYWT